MSEALLTSKQKKRKRSEGTCILCSKECSEQRSLKDVGWKSLQKKSELWVGLDTFGQVAETVSWTSIRVGIAVVSSRIGVVNRTSGIRIVRAAGGRR